MLEITLELKDTILDTFKMDKDEITIGCNSANDITIDNLAISDRHARIVRDKTGYYLEDLKSTNGTFVDGPYRPGGAAGGHHRQTYPGRQAAGEKRGRIGFRPHHENRPFLIQGADTPPGFDLASTAISADGCSGGIGIDRKEKGARPVSGCRRQG